MAAMDSTDVVFFALTSLVLTVALTSGQGALMSAPGLVKVHQGEEAHLAWAVNASFTRNVRGGLLTTCPGFLEMGAWRLVNGIRVELSNVQRFSGFLIYSNMTTLFIEESSLGFYIKNITIGNAGGYGVYFNHFGPVSITDHNATIFVYDTPSRAQIVAGSVALTCRSASTSQPDAARPKVTMVYTWAVNGIALTAHNVLPHFSLSSPPTANTPVLNNQLTIRALRCGHQATYTCRAREDGSRLVSEESDGFRLQIPGCTDHSNVVYRPMGRVVTASEGGNATFALEVEDSIEVALGVTISCSWYYTSEANLEVTLPDGIDVRSVGTSCEMRVPSVHMTHTGRYVITLRVHSEEYAGAFQLNLLDDTPTRAQVVAGSVGLHRPVALTCRSASTSQPDAARLNVTMVYTWAVNGIALTASNAPSHFSLSNAPTANTPVLNNQLTIRALRCGHQATYTCRASEDGSRLVSEESDGFRLQIPGCSDQRSNVVYRPMGRVVMASEGEDATFALQVEDSIEVALGVTISCSWYYISEANLEVTLPDGIDVRSVGTSCEMRVPSVHMTHTGRYVITLRVRAEEYAGAFQLNLLDGEAPGNQTQSTEALPQTGGLSGGHVGGIVIGVLFLLILLLGVALFLLWLKRKALMEKLGGVTDNEPQGVIHRLDSLQPDVDGRGLDDQGTGGLYETVTMSPVTEEPSVYASLQPDLPRSQQDSYAAYEMVLTRIKLERLVHGSVLHSGHMFRVQRVTHKVTSDKARELVLKTPTECGKVVEDCGRSYLGSQVDVIRLLTETEHLLAAVASCRHETVLPLFDYHPLGSLSDLLVEKAAQGRDANDNVAIVASSTSLAFKVALLTNDQPPWKFAVHAAKGLAALHEAKEEILVHTVSADHVILALEGREVVGKLSGFASGSHVRERRLMERQQNLWNARWLAPETVSQLEHAKSSDVWGLGVLLWEIASSGEIPYSEMNERTVEELVASGKRLARPHSCNMEMYRVMMSCWRRNPSSRPAARDLVETIEAAQ